MMPPRRISAALLVLLVALLAPPALDAQVLTPPRSDTTAAPPVPSTAMVRAALDTVQPGRFDMGRMWTFDVPPVDHFRTTYGIAADSAWFARARLGALRIPNCSASLVSPAGLVLTNHHCARSFITQVSGPGEELLDEGFVAETLAEEREVEDFHADRLIAIRDVSARMADRIGGDTGPDRAAAIEEETAEIEEELIEEFGGERPEEDEEEPADGIVVEVIGLYDGAYWSAYVFRRHTRAKLVMAPELQLGFFGGDADNFTYPRYNLDMAFFRLYDEDGDPLSTPDYFRWSLEGVSEGDPVFVVGNPGTTRRQQTMAQLLFRREIEDPAVLSFLTRRAEVLEEYVEAFPDSAEVWDVRNDWFSAENSIKATRGQIEGLYDPVILAKKEKAERALVAEIRADSARLGVSPSVVARIADLQDEKRPLAPGYGAFLALTAPGLESPTLHRAILAFQVLNARQAGAPPEAVAGLLAQIDSVGDAPAVLDELLIAARIEEFIEAYGGAGDSRWLESILRGRTPEGTAAVIRSGSVLSDSAATVEALRTGRLDGNDPAIRFVSFYVPEFAGFQQAYAGIVQREEELQARLGRARFGLRGWTVPPDATFSLRIADGVVRGYEYNGTVAPPFTTWYGMYDRHFGFAGDDPDSPWALPDRWETPPAGLDLSVPLNFVSTVDIIGGNSGSPVLNADLEIVGVVFDGNIESLPGDYIFLPERNRAITVDARAILEALGAVYDADRLVEELTAGAAVPAGGGGW